MENYKLVQLERKLKKAEALFKLGHHAEGPARLDSSVSHWSLISGPVTYRPPYDLEQVLYGVLPFLTGCTTLLEERASKPGSHPDIE